jgi:hypothetical protein
MNKIYGMKGDIFIHGGDFTGYGNDKHFEQFFNFLEKLNFTHKIVIAGYKGLKYLRRLLLHNIAKSQMEEPFNINLTIKQLFGKIYPMILNCS